MAKRATTEDHLATLRKLRDGVASPAAIAELAEMLKSPRLHGIVLKGAAVLAEKWDVRTLIEPLCAAADGLAPERLGTEANKRDPGCEGKEAVLHALITWDAVVPEFYARAVKWVQQAPVMGGSVDVAAECRGLAALGIAQTRLEGMSGTGRPERAIEMIVEVLADAEAKARVRAAQALGMWRGGEAVPVLRLKAHVGDEMPEVLGETFASLLRQDAQEQLSFVARFLEDDDERMVEAAALAMGESRLVAALVPLTAACERHAGSPIGSSVLMALALLRQEESLAWLLKRMQKCRGSEAGNIVDALRIYRGDEKVTGRIGAAARERGGEAERVFGALFEK